MGILFPFGKLVLDHGEAELQFGQRLFGIDALALKAGDAFGEFLFGVLKLRGAAVAGIVEVENLADLGKREADAPAAQNERDARPVAPGIDARLAAARGRDQAFVFIVAQGAGGDPELPRQIADGIGAAQNLMPDGCDPAPVLYRGRTPN